MAKNKTTKQIPANVPIEFLSEKELRQYIQTAGKRAQSRIKTLSKAYKPGGSLAGRQSYVLDRYGGFTTQVKGLNIKALRLKAEQAQAILSAKSSTVKGVKEIDAKRLESFKRAHPNAKVTKKVRGREYQRSLSKQEWKLAMRIMGRLQAAEKSAKYDSNEQLFMAFKLATSDSGASVTDNGEKISESELINNLLFNDSGDLKITSADFFAQAPLAESLDFTYLEDV